MIEVHNINKSFNGKQVLKDISTSFLSGKTNLIIGRSGSGKTVLLKVIAGLVQAEVGNVLYDKKNVVLMKKDEHDMLRRRIGMVFQGGALFDSMTVAQNVQFPLDMFSKQTAAQKRDRVNFCLERVNIEDAHQKHPGELSGGMIKRVAIARAIVLRPKFLLCDEPNSGLDPITATRIDKLISSITSEFNMTTIVNTHDMNSVSNIGEQVIFLHKGIKEWEGSSKNILAANSEALHEFIATAKDRFE